MKKRMLMCLTLFVVITSIGFARPASERNVQPIGIISAMNSELNYLVSQTQVTRSDNIGGMTFFTGKLNGKDVVLVKGGVGKSLSAAGTATLITQFNVSKIIFTGIAGGVQQDTNVLDVVIGTELVNHDYGTQTNNGYVWRPGPDNISSIPADPILVDLAYKTAQEVAGAERGVYKGVIATGDQFIASETYVSFLRTQFNAYATEMEGASVALVAYKFQIPFVVVRVNSDLADGAAHETIANFGDTAALISQQIVLKLLEKL